MWDDEAIAHLDARQPEHMPGPSIERIEALVKYTDHPERTYPTIHVTGTTTIRGLQVSELRLAIRLIEQRRASRASITLR